MALIEYFLKFFRYISMMGVMDIVDVLITAFIIYKLIAIIRRTSSSGVARGIIVLLVALWLSGLLKLHVINFALRKAVEIGLIALVVLFQPELRRFLERVGRSGFSTFLGKQMQIRELDSAITQTALACGDMSRSKTGALIVFERVDRLDDQMRTGTVLDAGVSAELLKNIFFNKAPLHDGAVIMRDGRIAAAGCMLPLSGNTNLSRELGMRHRAGIGMTEYTDAISVIVSEETGAISFAINGMIKRHLTPEMLEEMLRAELLSEEDEPLTRRERLLQTMKAIKEKRHEK